MKFSKIAKKYKKYATTFLLFFCVMCLSMPILYIGNGICWGVYGIMNDISPELYPIYNREFQAEEYEALAMHLRFIGSIISAPLIIWLSTLFDGFKKNFFRKKTGGMFTLKEGMKLYYSEYLLCDIVAIVLTCALVVLALYSKPDNQAVRICLFLPQAIANKLGVLLPGVIIGGISMLFQPFSAWFAIRNWRGALLAHNVEM